MAIMLEFMKEDKFYMLQPKVADLPFDEQPFIGKSFWQVRRV